MKWIADVKEDSEDPEGCILVFPQEMLDHLKWKEGDTLVWEITTTGEITLKKE